MLDHLHSVSSSGGHVHVHGWGPVSGPADVEITVYGMASPYHTTRQLRVTVDAVLLPTKLDVSPIDQFSAFTARASILTASISAWHNSATVRIEVLDEQGQFLDDFVLGTFTWSPHLPSQSVIASPSPELQSFIDIDALTQFSCMAPSDIMDPPIYGLNYDSQPLSPYATSTSTAPSPTQSSPASSHASAPSSSATSFTSLPVHSIPPRRQPLVRYVKPLESFVEGWTVAERDAGRRLVQFSIQPGQDDRRTVLCRTVLPTSRIPPASILSVVSCITGPDGEHFITSVDLLRLAALLFGTQPGVDEKNRLRRHLERYHPRTIGRLKDGSGIYQRIAMYDEPSPLTINKDVKIFHWSRLEDALDAIMAKHVADRSRFTSARAKISSLQKSPQAPL
jgi:hypothetical protein